MHKQQQCSEKRAAWKTQAPLLYIVHKIFSWGLYLKSFLVFSIHVKLLGFMILKFVSVLVLVLVLVHVLDLLKVLMKTLDVAPP
jgi:hypothetical protein